MNPLWFPMSALLDAEIDCWASPAMLRLPLGAGSPVRLRYVGDHMWPAFGHGQALEVRPSSDALRAGDLVVAASGTRVELWRVAEVAHDGVWVIGDSSTDPPARLGRGDVLGVIEGTRSLPGRIRRGVRRGWLECREALARDFPRAAATVRDKYDLQAGSYAMHGVRDPGEEWRDSVRRHLSGGRLLVVGSGTGQECHALASMGFECVGIDFSANMIAEARRLAREARLRGVVFERADIRAYEPAAADFAAVLFTPDVYSFIPRRRERIAVLRRLAAGLRAGGSLLLSARVFTGAWSHAVLALQWLRSGCRHDLGDSHTRFLSPDGTVHRSFVHCFTARTLRREYEAAGLTAVAEEKSFVVLQTELK